ncbi:MAG: hypothetical protein WAK17_24020, partial [Candidatus Nitrosopolaris sp.]
SIHTYCDWPLLHVLGWFFRWIRFLIGFSIPPCTVNGGTLYKGSDDERCDHSPIEQGPNFYPPNQVSLGRTIGLTVCNSDSYT